MNKILPWVLLGASNLSQAQTVPDAGALSQPLQRGDRMRDAAPTVAPTSPPAALPMPEVSGLKVEVKRFAFAGNTRFASSELAPLVAPYLNRSLDFKELLAAAQAVATFYRQSGWFVQTYLPAQDLQAGEVTIQVLEAEMGGMRFESSLSMASLKARVESIYAAQVKPGQALSEQQLDRAALLSSDLGVSVVTTLQAGATPQSTDVAVKVTEVDTTTFNLGVDNAGSVSTGEYRLNGSGRFGNMLAAGDRLQWNATHSEGSDFVRLAYSQPVGYDGWRVGLNGSDFNYRLISADLTALHAQGTASTLGLEASYPIVLTRQHKLQFTLNYDSRAYKNQASNTTVTNYRVNSLGLGLLASRYDAASNAYSTAAVNLTGGDLDLSGSPNQGLDALTTRSAGTYSKVRYSFSHQQDIAPDLSVFAAWTLQTSDKNLDSSEKLYLGGADGVRAFPTGEAGGSEGQLLNLQLRWRLSPGWELSPFYDAGSIRVNRSNQFAGAPILNRYDLQGAGLSLGWQPTSRSEYRLSWARRLRANPNPTNQGNDQDGTLREDRIWSSANWYF